MKTKQEIEAKVKIITKKVNDTNAIADKMIYAQWLYMLSWVLE